MSQTIRACKAGALLALVLSIVGGCRNNIPTQLGYGFGGNGSLAPPSTALMYTEQSKVRVFWIAVPDALAYQLYFDADLSDGTYFLPTLPPLPNAEPQCRDPFPPPQDNDPRAICFREFPWVGPVEIALTSIDANNVEGIPSPFLGTEVLGGGALEPLPLSEAAVLEPGTGFEPAAFGRAVAAGRDVNGDGLPDVVVTDPDAKRINVYSSPTKTAGIDVTPSVTAVLRGDRPGLTIALADVHDDGIADIVLGNEVFTPLNDPMFQSGGGGMGTQQGLRGDGELFTFTGEPGNIVEFGSPVAGANNAELGFSLVGAFESEVSPALEVVVAGEPGVSVNTGDVGLFKTDGTSNLVRDGAWVMPGSNLATAGDRFGQAVASYKDPVTGEVYLAVGAPGVSGDNAIGYVSIACGLYAGSTSGVVTGADANGLFGSSIAFGDFDGDSLPDLAVGAPQAGPGGRGAVYIYELEPGGSCGWSDATWQSWPALPKGLGAGFGSTMVAADFNGDGYDDIAFAGPPADAGAGPEDQTVYVHLGEAPPGFDPKFAELEYTADGLGVSLAAADLDGSRSAELVMGAVGALELGASIAYGPPTASPIFGPLSDVIADAAKTITLDHVAFTDNVFTQRCDVEWGDGETESLEPCYGFNGGTHTYAEDGVYRIRLRVTMPQFASQQLVSSHAYLTACVGADVEDQCGLPPPVVPATAAGGDLLLRLLP